MTMIARTASYWADFPVTYRAEEVAQIMSWVTSGESGIVIGSSGTGKSNLAGFLGSRLDAITPHVRDKPDKYCFLHLDVNSLPMLNIPFFYRGLIQILQDLSEEFGPDIQQAMQSLTEGQVNWDDLFQVMTILQKAHYLIIHQTGKTIIWLLDRFDELCRRFDTQTLSSLRSLRDQFKGQLCYVLFTRYPLARLRNLNEIDEFYDIVAANTCWVGPMVERDARWIAGQMAERLHATFDEPDIQQLIAVSGGLPAFMKAGCLALAENAIDQGKPAQTWVPQLLQRQEFWRSCQQIWNDLNDEEQLVFNAINAGESMTKLNEEVVTHLTQTGLVRPQSNGKLKLFSPLLAAFVSQQQDVTTGFLTLHPKTRAVLRDGVPLDIELTTNEDRLLSYFLEHAEAICRKDTLIHAVWPDEEIAAGIRDDRLAQLVKRLREKIELDPSNPTYIQTIRGRGYRFIQQSD